MSYKSSSSRQQGVPPPRRSSAKSPEPVLTGTRQPQQMPKESPPIPEAARIQYIPPNQVQNRYKPSSSGRQYAPSDTQQPRQIPPQQMPPMVQYMHIYNPGSSGQQYAPSDTQQPRQRPPRVGSLNNQFPRTNPGNSRHETPMDPTIIQQNAAREQLYKTVNTAREYMTNNAFTSGNTESKDQYVSRLFQQITSQLNTATTPSTPSSSSTLRGPDPDPYDSPPDSDGSGASDSDDSPTVYRGKTPERAFPYTPEARRPLDPRVSSPGAGSQFSQHEQIYDRSVPSPNTFASPRWSPDTRVDSQQTAFMSPGSSISPRMKLVSRQSSMQGGNSAANGKIRGSSVFGGTSKGQTMLERMERLVTNHKTMEAKMSQHRDVHLVRTRDPKPDKEPQESQFWPEDEPSWSSGSEDEDPYDRQNNFYGLQSSRSPRIDHSHSSTNVQQATHGLSQLRVRYGEHSGNTTNTTGSSIGAEYDNEEEEDEGDELPDLSGTVKISNPNAVFAGTYSSVYKGEWEGLPVAVKVIRAVGSLKATRRKYRRESRVWSRLSHPNILPLYGLCLDSDFGPFGALVSPWCSNGNSAECVHRMERASDRIRLLLGVANGVRYLHEHVDILVHGDLKPANILVDGDGVARLCDFGLVRLIKEGSAPSGMTTTTAHTGTVRYLAQELVSSEHPMPTTQTDCHALGCIALEFAYLHPPYAHRSSNAGLLYTDISKGVPPSYRPEIVNELLWGHTLLWDLFEACWHPQPDQRPSSTQIYNYLTQHEYTIVEALDSFIEIF